MDPGDGFVAEEIGEVREETTPRMGGLAARVLSIWFWANLALLLGVYFAQFETPLWSSWDPARFGYAASHVTAAGIMTVLWYVQKKGSAFRWLMAPLLVAGFITAGYYFYTNAAAMELRSSYGTLADMSFAGLLFALCIYISWIHWGPIFPILGFIFMGYLFIADLLPEPFTGPPLGIQQIFTRAANKMFVGITILAATFLWVLVFWGMVMNTAGAGVAIRGLARLLTRAGIAGGPALGCLFASALTGSFVGGGPSNVAITGPITIPAMRSAGYSREMAGAVEAMASNASGITPPVLGAVAFIMADVIGVSYLEIIAMSMVPAFLWFLAAGTYIYAHAQQNRGAIGMASDTGSFEEDYSVSLYVRSVLLMAVPVSVILYLVLQGYTLKTGTFGAFLTLIVLAPILRVETRWSVWAQGIRRAAFYASSVTIILVIVALIADSIFWTGLGGRLGGYIEDVSHGYLLIAGVIMIAAGIVLGAGLPALPIYFIVSITFAPTLSRMGVPFLVSHYTAFYIGNLSTIIPPIAASALVAAVVAQTRYWAICRVLVKITWPLWIYPLLFLIAPELLLQGDSSNGMTLLVIISSAIVVIGVQTATAGWLLHSLTFPVRVVLYANFALLIVALRQDSVVLMFLCIGIVPASAAVSFFVRGRRSKPMGAAASATETSTAGS